MPRSERKGISQMTSRMLAGLFGVLGRAKSKSPATHRAGHELPGSESDFEPRVWGGAFPLGVGTTETRVAEALLFGAVMRR